MARIRYLKPDFFKDEHIKDLPYEVRLFYQGLWCQADKEGRLEDRPERLKVEIMPYNDVDIDKMLDILAKPKRNRNHPFIIRYEIEGERYIQIVNWHKHQRPHHTEAESIIPPLITSSLGFEIDTIKGKEKQEEAMVRLSNGVNTVSTPLSTLFEEIWGRYPNRVGKKLALRHFKSSIKSDKDWENIQQALKNYLVSARVQKGFVQNGATWFNNWKDWVEFSEPLCPECKGKGKYISRTGYEVICTCEAGLRK